MTSHIDQIKQLTAERDALLKAVVIKAGGAGVLFIPDILCFSDENHLEVMQTIAKETGMTVVSGPVEGIEMVEIIEQAPTGESES